MSSKLQPTIKVPKEVLNLLKAMGAAVPDNIKEIETETVYDDETKKIVLPRGMDKMTAAKELKAQWENEETQNDYDVTFDGWNWRDVLVAVRRVTEREFGWMNGQADWWTGNPKEIDVVVDIKNGKHVNEKAFLGNFRLTSWEKADATVSVNKQGTVVMRITAKRKYSEVITNYFNAIREQLETDSIYRGKSIMVTANEDGGINFEIIENKISNKIVLNQKEQSVINTFVLGELGDKGKRCYLFTGSFGNGKTETAMMIGHHAVENHKMSFFYLKEAKAFATMLHQSKKYQPCLIFMEDIDEIASGEQRDAEMNNILNTLDGVQTKGNDLKVIFTTNNESRIAPALRRPGRIDLMMQFVNPEEDTKAKIFEVYFNEIPGASKLDYTELAKITPNVSGAVIAEICKRAVKVSKKEKKITQEIVVACVASMEYQIRLMEDAIQKVDDRELALRLLGQQLGDAIFSHGKGESVYESAQN